MKFTDTNITPTPTTKICSESATEKGYLTPDQIVLIGTIYEEVNTASDYEVENPAGPTVFGRKHTIYLTSIGGGSLTLDAAILLPSDSAVSFPKVIASGKTYIIQLTCGHSGWMLTSLVGGY